MRASSLIALKLGRRAPSPPTPASALRPVLDRALALIGNVVLAVEDESDRRELTEKLDQFRIAFESADDVDSVTALTGSCFDMCERAVHTLQAQQLGQRTELRRLVALVRDTVRILVGDGEAFSSDIAQVATRFHALLHVDDVQELKRRLVNEVGDLQRVAAERQQQWQQSVSMCEARIATLERQLVVVRQEAEVDSLTGILNRRYFEQALRDAMRAPDASLIVALVDLDDFKAVNDSGGHAAGDRVLKAVALALKTSVRRGDVVARMGGDEFALLGTGATLRTAESRIRVIMTALAQIPTGFDDPVHVSVSCGLTEYCAGDTVESLMSRADRALYDAKHQGKNRFVVQSPPFIRNPNDPRAHPRDRRS